MENKKTKVLIVDDSAIVRNILSDSLSKEKNIEVVGTAPDPYIAREKIIKLTPDVITLDIEMPKMDGLTFLKKIMKYNPLPVVIVSSLTQRGTKMALDALEYGAVDVVAKPGGPFSVGEMSTQLVNIINAASKIDFKEKYQIVEREKDSAVRKTTKKVERLIEYAPTPTKASRIATGKFDLIVIGSSTGGTEALRTILSDLPHTLPPIAIVQHMPAGFTKTFAERLDEECVLSVKEASNGDLVVPGWAYIAPGGYHIVIKQRGKQIYVQTNQGPLINHQRPAVDVLFNSVSKLDKLKIISIILTGMGSDGAKGMLSLKQNGAYTMAQDEKSSIIFGMPKEAIKLGAIDKIVTLKNIAREIKKLTE